MRIEWRRLPTVLTEDEMLDKAFGRAKKAADRVEDSNRVFRTKTTLRMVQTASDVLCTTLLETVGLWPSLDQSPTFDVAMIEAWWAPTSTATTCPCCNGARGKSVVSQHKTFAK